MLDKDPKMPAECLISEVIAVIYTLFHEHCFSCASYRLSHLLLFSATTNIVHNTSHVLSIIIEHYYRRVQFCFLELDFL